MASADRENWSPTSERVEVCEISTQLSRITVLVSAQLKSGVSELASWVVRRGCVVQRAGQGDQKDAKVGGRRSLYMRGSLAARAQIVGPKRTASRLAALPSAPA